MQTLFDLSFVYQLIAFQSQIENNELNIFVTFQSGPINVTLN